MKSHLMIDQFDLIQANVIIDVVDRADTTLSRCNFNMNRPFEYAIPSFGFENNCMMLPRP